MNHLQKKTTFSARYIPTTSKIFVEKPCGLDSSFFFFGRSFAETRDWAGNLQIFSLTLSQLSYFGKHFPGGDIYQQFLFRFSCVKRSPCTLQKWLLSSRFSTWIVPMDPTMKNLRLYHLSKPDPPRNK